jgi:hypothetical protein
VVVVSYALIDVEYERATATKNESFIYALFHVATVDGANRAVKVMHDIRA